MSGSPKNSKSSRVRAAVYCRISEDTLGLERGVQRQQEDCEALAAGRGWDVVSVHVDNDISALRGQLRPGYEALMKAAKQGGFDWIVAYQLSRLWRNRSERAEAIEALSKAGVSVALVKGSELNLTNAGGRLVAGIMGEVDTAESEIKAERVARAARQRAQEGRANARCAYGWRRVYQRNEQGRVLGWEDVVDEPAAAVVRSIVRDLLSGVTLRAITARLNDEGAQPPQGDRWITSSVRKLAVRDLNVGIRRYGNETFQAAWEPIIDEEQHLRVKALLADPSRRTQRAAARSHLLTFGIGKCGVCGGVLVVSRKGPPGKKTPLYVCREQGCVGRREDWVDELVIRTVCLRLENSDAGPIFGDDADGHTLMEKRRHRDALRARLDDAADAFAKKLIDLQQLTRISEKLRPEYEAAEDAVRRADPAVPEFVEEFLAAPNKRAAWDGLSLTQQRKTLEVFRLEVVIKPARGGPGFKEDSIDVNWLGDY